MNSVIYIDHIKLPPEGEHKEIGSIIRRLNNPDHFGIITSLSADHTMGSMLRIGKIGDQFRILNSILDALNEYQLIKCQIKFKQ